MRDAKRITEKKFLNIINEEYSEIKKILHPRYKGINRSFVKFYWLTRKQGRGGVCWQKSKKIVINPNCRESEEEFRSTVRHEIVHLIEPNHGDKFLRCLEAVKGGRFVGSPAFIMPNKK